MMMNFFIQVVGDINKKGTIGLWTWEGVHNLLLMAILWDGAMP